MTIHLPDSPIFFLAKILLCTVQYLKVFHQFWCMSTHASYAGMLIVSATLILLTVHDLLVHVAHVHVLAQYTLALGGSEVLNYLCTHFA